MLQLDELCCDYLWLCYAGLAIFGCWCSAACILRVRLVHTVWLMMVVPACTSQKDNLTQYASILKSWSCIYMHLVSLGNIWITFGIFGWLPHLQLAFFILVELRSFPGLTSLPLQSFERRWCMFSKWMLLSYKEYCFIGQIFGARVACNSAYVWSCFCSCRTCSHYMSLLMLVYFSQFVHDCAVVLMGHSGTHGQKIAFLAKKRHLLYLLQGGSIRDRVRLPRGPFVTHELDSLWHRTNRRLNVSVRKSSSTIQTFEHCCWAQFKRRCRT